MLSWVQQDTQKLAQPHVRVLHRTLTHRGVEGKVVIIKVGATGAQDGPTPSNQEFRLSVVVEHRTGQPEGMAIELKEPGAVGVVVPKAGD